MPVLEWEYHVATFFLLGLLLEQSDFIVGGLTVYFISAPRVTSTGCTIDMTSLLLGYTQS